MHKLRRLLVTIDDAVYAIERILLLFSMTMMIALVFADVIQRTFSRPVGKTADMLVWVARLFGELSQETITSLQTTVADALFVTLAVFFCIAGTQSARNFSLRHKAADEGGDETASAAFAPSIGIGLAVFFICWGVIEVLLTLAPQGIPGAQKFALGFFVWSGFIGASLAVRAKRHIVLDAVKKKLSDDVAPIYGFLSALLTSLFCGFIAYMGYLKGFAEVDLYIESEGIIGVYEALPVPEFIVTFAIPVFLTIASLRFFASGLSDLLFGAPLSTGADEHGIDFEALERQHAQDRAAAAEQPAGFVIGRPHNQEGVTS